MKQLSLPEFNHLPEKVAEETLRFCCGSFVWASKMVQLRPFRSFEDLKKESSRVWNSLSEQDWKEAFSHHPKIGDLESLKKKFASTEAWAAEEQKGSQGASEQILQALARDNESYENRFGYIFIVYATGKTAAEMLEILKKRLKNEPQAEIKIAAQEQDKITQVRLEKLIYE